MANAIVTPGYVFANNELVTYTKLNLLGQPVVQNSGASGGGAALNYFHNGNFYGPSWLTPAGVSAPPGVETFNASQWSVNPSGATVSYAQDSSVPVAPTSTIGTSLYSLKITGATSVTNVNLSQRIPADLAVSLDTTVALGMYIKNNTGTSFTPVLTVFSCNTLNNYTALTGIYSQSLGIIASGTWLFESASFNLAGLSNVANGLVFTITIPSGSLNSNAKSVNFSQAMLQIGTSTTAFFDDLSYFPPPLTPQLINAQIGYTPLFSPNNNLVANGNAEVWQESPSYTSAVTAGTPIADCWKYQQAGTMVSTISINGAQVGPLDTYNPFFNNSLKVAITTAQASLGSNDLLIVKNMIEGYYLIPTLSRTLCLQFWVKSSTIGQYSVGLGNGTDHVVYYTYNIATANVWQQVVINGIPAFPASAGSWNFTNGLGCQLTWTLAAGASQQSISPAGVWYAAVIPTLTGQTNLAATIGNSWEVSGVQLEPGLYATPLNKKSFPEELIRCQRYYCKSYDYSTAPGTVVAGGVEFYMVSTTTSNGYAPFPVPMRTAPTAIVYSPVTGTVNTYRDVIAVADRASSANTLTAFGIIKLSTASTNTAASSGFANSANFHFVADARL